jgi:hypothetical protein
MLFCKFRSEISLSSKKVINFSVVSMITSGFRIRFLNLKIMSENILATNETYSFVLELETLEVETLIKFFTIKLNDFNKLPI